MYWFTVSPPPNVVPRAKNEERRISAETWQQVPGVLATNLPFARGLLGRGSLGLAAGWRVLLLCRLRCCQLRYRLAGHGVGDAKPAAEVFEHVTKSIQERTHLGACIHDVLEPQPFTDKAKRLIPRLDQVAAEKALERGSQSTMGVDELLLIPGFHSKTHHVECCHVTPLFVLDVEPIAPAVDILRGA
jgi:hypothetical protein